MAGSKAKKDLVQLPEMPKKVKFWVCMQHKRKKEDCEKYNDMKLKQCRGCGARRDAGDIPTTDMGVELGVLDSVDNKTGEEHWLYDSGLL
jgi:hypothetical protein